MLDYDRRNLDEIDTAVDGDIGMAWGFYTESFKIKGKEPEFVHARFTWTLKKYEKGWRTILYHRDAQHFDDKGNYIPSPKRAAGFPSVIRILPGGLIECIFFQNYP